VNEDGSKCPAEIKEITERTSQARRGARRMRKEEKGRKSCKYQIYGVSLQPEKIR
jgi:hypothetical protein